MDTRQIAASAFEQRIRAEGDELYRLAGGAPPSLFDSHRLHGRLLRKAVTDDPLRTALFQLVDVLPALDTAHGITEHFRDYLQPHLPRLGGGWRLLLALGGTTLAAGAVRRSVASLARRFVAEESAEGLARAVTQVATIPAALTVDAVGEAVLSEAAADTYAARYLTLLGLLNRARLRGSPPIHVSIKLSALTADFDPLAEAEVRRRIFARIDPIIRELQRLRGGMTIDMEQYEHKPLVLDLFRALVERYGDGGWAPGIALQAYLPETEQDLLDLISWARRTRQRIAIRLVKGAYWDTELAIAEQRGWPAPVWLDKAATDRNFERLTVLLFDHIDAVRPAIATHNLRSLAHACAAARDRHLAPDDWEVQMLFGMAEPLRHAASRRGLNLRIYLPTGELIPGIAYLIRRLMENTAGTSMLRQAYLDGASLDELLARPVPTAMQPASPPPFANLPLRDFSQTAAQQRFRQALRRVRAELGRTHPLAIPGASVASPTSFVSVNPADPGEVLGRVIAADATHAEQAVRNARSAFALWRETTPVYRAALCRKAADLIEAQRDELAAWEVLEVGKNWREADADVAEAVDYLRYYAMQMEALSGWQPTRCFPGEQNHLRYEPRGVAVIISPWNFPLAILAGMASAALAAGNTAILKPASPAALIACRFHSLLLEAGFPPNVCQLLPGSGATLGSFLVSHPDVQLIAFTGSREVGSDILRKAHEPRERQAHVKQVVCEMGGKNAVIVDDDADLDEAVPQILQSAFGYQGQKCSAASRLIAVGKVHDRLVERLAAALDSHPYGPPEDPLYRFGPLISAEARQKVQDYLRIGRSEGSLYYLGRVPDHGYYHPPAIFTAIEPHHRLAREEIFGPLLAVLRAPDFETALAMALDSDFALTGGVFSRRPRHLALARDRFRVGDLYLNRRITGARVGIQPFGGVRLSGTGIQAGGPDYLKQFLWTRVVTENTLRHGFVPPGNGATG